MNTPRHLAVLVVASALAWRCGAEPVRVATPDSASITLSTAIHLALDQPAARAASYEAEAGAALVGQADRFPNPALSYLREGRQAGTRTTTVQIDQTIELGNKRRARVALAQEAAGLARIESAARRQAIRADVIAAYHDVLGAGHRLALAQALTGVARKTVDVAGKRVAAGKISPIDETRARLAAVDATTAFAQATAAQAIARTRLGALIGRPSATIVLADDSDRLPDAEPLAALLARAGDAAAIRRARGQVAARQAQVDVERAARVPDVTLSVGTKRDDQIGRRQAVVGLSVPLPLFNRNEDALRAALRRTDQAGEELAAARVETAAALTAAHTRYETARNEVLLLRRDVVPNAQAAYEQTLKGFEYGKFSFLDVLDAQRTWFQAQSRQWDSLDDAWRAYADIERLAGPIEQY
jgi:cobalt-zinc-cadmium efflux system outer membrane protein